MQLLHEPRRSGPVLLAASLTVVGVYTVSPAAMRTQETSISVNAARPLANTIEILEHRYGWSITYEDAPYQYAGDMKDVSREVRRNGTEGKPKVYVARGGVFNVEYATPSEAAAPDPDMVLRRVLLDYNASGLPGEFRLVRQGTLLHVVPAGVRDRAGVKENRGSILSVRMSLPNQERDALSMVSEIVKAVTSVAGVKVHVGLVPDNLLSNTKVTFGADQDVARDVLVRTLAATGQNLTWQLFYMPSETVGAYYLNVHVVKRVQ
jgi:hypothetical protein